MTVESLEIRAPSRGRRGLRSPLLPLGLLLALVAALAVLTARGNQNRLDPDSYAPQGSHALAQLLRDGGVEVIVARDLAAARRALGAGPARASLLVTEPDLLTPEAMRDLARRSVATVLVEARGPVVEATLPQARAAAVGETTARDPGCDLPAATRAGRADAGGVRYAATSGSPRLCFGGSLLAADGRVLLGSGAALTNGKLDERGNAALALALLGERPTLVWYLPRLDDPALFTDADRRSLTSLIPEAWKLAALQLAIGLALLALWRARRLGPVVLEPLPVVVRAAEATEGLARLYRRSGARSRAAAELRAAAVRRIAPRFGMSATHADPRAVTESVAAHTGRSTADVGQLLYGATPDTDAGLLALTAALDDLERQVSTERKYRRG
ncbi:MAG: DUF4350 domain-containing protein [Sporichthyaceae bacterium]